MSKGSIEINYRKIRPLDFDSLGKHYELSDEDVKHEYNPFILSQVSAFNPLYTEFFVLNDTNYDRVGLNHEYYMEGDQIQGLSPDKSYHVKSSPLLDPVHYLVGKYNTQSPNLRILPNLSNAADCFPKLANKQNASYIDGFFCYLSSQMRNTKNMLNAVDFYGSYLAVQRVFKATITDDVDYLHQSDFFMNRLGKEFTVSCGAHASGLGFDDFTGIGSRTNKKRLIFGDDELSPDDLGIADLTPDAREDSEPEGDGVVCEYENGGVESDSSSDDEDLNYSSSDERGSKESDDSGSEDSGSEDSETNDSETKDSESGSKDSESESLDSDSEDESEAYAYIKDFPVNLIFLEKCDGTLDRLFLDQEIDPETGAACLMQVIMSLLAFQKAFHLTHNDLHTNNIMYVNTDIEYLYYKYNNQFYRVPTYGRIFKIIDFGRAIYRFKDRVYCSDSFAPKGDAHSQYNTEPYFNDKKPRIEPNLSFDLCRLGTSIYDFIIQDEEDERDEFQETIYRWCLDDNGKNIMYKRDGEERYPGFKLYKMIAKNVHAHLPQEQLKYPMFSQFLVNPEDAAKLDEREVRQNGLNIDLVEREYNPPYYS